MPRKKYTLFSKIGKATLRFFKKINKIKTYEVGKCIFLLVLLIVDLF